MRPLARALCFGSALVWLGCEARPNDGEVCPIPVEPSPLTYSIGFDGFPEISGELLVDSDGELDFTSACTITQLDFAADELELVLACEHPDSTDATVTITTAASGVPTQLAVDTTVNFSALVFYDQGGDRSGGVFRSLANVQFQQYIVTDETGVVFVAVQGGVDGSFGSIEIETKWSCPDWSPCADDPISGYIQARSNDASVDVQIGELAELHDGELGWDVRLFQARLGGCHGHDGGFSIVRRPD